MWGKLLLARSLDGGLTWKSEDPDNYVGDGGEITTASGKINFIHSDCTMRIKNKPERFWYLMKMKNAPEQLELQT